MAVEVLVIKESAAGERRVAATPETARKLAALGANVWFEPGAGAAAGFSDQAYLEAGAHPAADDLAARAASCCACSAPHRPGCRR